MEPEGAQAMTKFLRPLRRFVLLYDDQPVQSEGGVVAVRSRIEAAHLDYLVVAVGSRENADFGPGDRVVLSAPALGRRVVLDGTVYRLVRVSDVVAVAEWS